MQPLAERQVCPRCTSRRARDDTRALRHELFSKPKSSPGSKPESVLNRDKIKNEGHDRSHVGHGVIGRHVTCIDHSVFKGEPWATAICNKNYEEFEAFFGF
ncbi:hypothetical protein EVAR_86514_1 [Eumeta japonica]|uniref:Uncharacterized protein n=1 Tax=Eumeta variegata TaxID=151549 RepID=A0A4C1VMN0_EUMVA|nr:hypothetical protein EVAR_86514_1 [Eumeta japonica]